MKLHLPVSLRKCLLSVLSAVSVICGTALAGVMHTDATFATYSDFGQNKGRYVMGNAVNSLLQHIRDTEGGIGIEYTDGTQTYYLSNEQGMIDFIGVHDAGHSGLVSPNMLATVLHNGSLNGSFSGNDIGETYAQNYSVIDIRGSNKFRVMEENGDDYMMQRQSRVVTDAIAAPISTIDVSTVTGQHMYHSGAGIMGLYDENIDTFKSLAWAYVFNIGDIDMLTGVSIRGDKGQFGIYKEVGYGNGIGASLENPLPNATRGGDSGSPVFIYNTETGQYEYLASHQSGNGRSWGQARGNLVWAHKTVKSYDVAVDLANTNEVHLGAVTTQGETISDNIGNSTTIWSGTVTAGDKTVSFKGVKDGQYTWRDMSDIKDSQTWYAYDADLYNASTNADGKLNLSDADLFYTENLVFTAGQSDNRIVLDATVDMGAGYTEFNKGSQEHAEFTITGAGKQLHTSGYVINDGVEVHLQLTNPSDYMTEWRKIGAGDLYIDGQGDTNALLNVGGSGATYLQQTGGYAAYNVLVNTGATVVIQDTNQIERDLTFGAGGGVLDMNGNSMNWYTSNGSTPRPGSFTINALTDEAMITNSSATAVTLTYKESGDTVYKGSFCDTSTGALNIDYQGGGTWTLHSIHTDLTHQAGSGLSVTNGKVVLEGTNTIHGTGSATATNQVRYENPMDWHYADASMSVTVKDGAVFELGSHARLTGDVNVKQGGTFVMREGVQHEQEYIEGGTKLQNTADFADFYGLKGGVALDAGADMLVQYSEGTTAATTYGGNISGAGNVTIDLGSDEMSLILSGTNTFTGTKTIASGGLVARSLAALGNTGSNKWLVEKEGWIASRGFKEGVDILSYIDKNSTGTLALSHNLSSQLNLANHQGLYLGAESGKTVHYGDEGTNLSLAAQNGAWRLGGGGGELVVNFLLEGANNLLLGAGEGATGSVYLANSGNTFSGTVDFNASGMKLGYADGALGSSIVNLSYGNGLVLNQAVDVARVAADSDGMLLLDNLGAEALDLSRFSSIALGASEDTTFSGSITYGSEGAYRFSSMNGATLRVTSALNADGNIIVDAQDSIGGTVVLAGNKYLSGEIQVIGSKDPAQGGSITLAAGQSMSLFGNISLGAGTSLDVAGNSVYLYQGISGEGQVVDTRSFGTLYLAARNGDLNHSLALNLATVRKTGDNALNLSGSHGFGALYVDAGSLVLANDFSTSLNSSIYLANGTRLNMQGGSVSTNIGMLDSAGTATLSIADNSTATLRGDIHLGSGSQLNMQATGGTFKLAGGSYGGENATLSVRAKELHFATGSSVDMLGTLSLENDMKLYSNGEATDMERNISNMQVNNNARITLDERTWSTVWNIDSLNGAGEILWNSNTTHETTSRLVLRGEGNFSGSISLDRKFENDERTHGAFIELAHDKAAQNASISLSGKSANAVASLAVNTKNAQIKGLSGNEHSYVYAGSAMSGAALMGDARPTTNRTATLTVNVDSGQEFTYAGTFGNSSDTISNGLSLNKTGAGIQKFTGAAYVNNITVQQGTLSLNAEKLSVRGDVGVATGATLNMGDYSLASGRTFSVLGGGSGPATFGGTLTLAGGSLSFSGAAMSSGTALSLGALNTGTVSSQSIHFTDTSSLKEGQTYTLASGDWSSIYQSINASGLHYYDATFGVNDSGNLQVSLALKSNSLVWDGTGSYATEWSDSKFGDSNASFNSSTTVVFDDSARSSYVGVFYCSQNVAAAVFNTTGSYTVVSYDGNQTHATARDLVVQGGGSVSINGGLHITNSTTIEEGVLILGQYCDGNTLKGTVTGAGTLVIDGASNVNPVLRDLGALRIKSGSYSSASGALDVDNIIVDSAGTYIHWHNYEGNITSNGGTLEIYSGSINGVLELNGDTSLVSLVTNTNDTFKLNATIVDNGYTITQTGNGLVDITPASQSILNNYVVKQGKLMFTGGSHSGHGKLTATESGTILIGSRANLSASNVHLSNGGTLDMQAQSTLMTDMTTSGAVAVKLGNETTYLKGSVTGSGTLSVSGQGVVQSLLADSADGALSLEVSGTAISLLAANTYSGGTTLNSGALYARNSHALGSGAVTVNGGTLLLDISGLGALGSVSAVTLNRGSVLDISAATFSADSGLALGGTLTVNEGAYINLGTLSTDNVKYTIFDLTSAGASAADWMSMQDRIMVNGSMLSNLSDWTLDLTSYGATLTFGTVLPDPLIWIGGESGIWSQTDNNWDNTPKVPDDSMAFTNGDSVVFNTSAAVQVAEGVEAQNMSIGSGVDLALSGDLTVTGAIIAEGDAFATSGNLTAEKITISSGTFETAAGKKLTAENVNQKGGSLSIKGAADIAQLDVAAGLSTQLYNETASDGAQKNIDKLVLGKGATLEVYDKESGASATTLGTLQLNGETATVQDAYNSSHVVVETLNMNTTLESATLSLVKNAGSDKVSRFEFGSDTAAAGNFKGCVELSIGNSNTNRPAAIIISGKDALAGAVVDLKSASSYIGLGINADNTTIAGLESGESVGSNAKLFSGTMGSNVKWDAQNTPATISTTERTLNINAAAGSTHTFHGEVLSKLNLVKQGEGTQVFNGTSAGFDGSLTVQGGTLKLGENALGMLGSASAVTVTGGMLDISSASYSQNAGLALGGALQVNGGALNLGSISEAGSYTIFDLSAAGASAAGWESWQDKLIVNGASLNRYAGASLSLTESAAQLSFSSMATTNYSDMVWNGGEKGVWDQTSSNWDRTPSVADDNIKFLNGDSVSFNASADITVADGVTVNGLTIAEGTALTTHGAVAVTGTLSTGTSSSWTLASGTNQSLTEAQLKSITSSLVVAEGATLTMTNKTTGENNTTTAFSKVSGAGDVVLNLGNDNGIGVNTSNLTGDIIVATGRLQVNASTFNAASTIRLASADSQLVFHSKDTELRNNVEVQAGNTSLYVNSGKSGIISGVISGEGGLNKQADGTLTFATQNTYKGATTISGGKIVLDTKGEYKLFNTVSGGGTLEVASGTTLANNGHAVTSALTLAEGSSWKISADNTGVYTLNTTVSGSGSIQLVSGTTFKNNGKALPGTVSLDAGSTWEVSGTSNNTYTLTKKVSGDGTMKLASGTTFVVDGDNNQVLAASVSIGENSTLRFNDAGGTGRSDMLDFNATSKTISVDGGTLDFGGTRQTMGTWTLELSDGAKVTGNGGAYSGKFAAMDYNKGSNNVIKATSGDSVISATSRLRGGSELTYEVAKEASLEVSGLVHADGDKNGGIVKTGDGTLHLNNANNDLDSVVVSGGTANIHGADAYNLAALQAATSAEVGFYAGITGDRSSASKVSVSSSTLLGAGSVLNMSLTLGAGSTLEMTSMVGSEGVILNGALTFSGKVSMGGSLLADVLSLGAGEVLQLFTGNGLCVSMGDVALTEAKVGDYFSNSELASMETYYVTYTNVGNVGSLVVVNVPEPATTTLSLLALSALVARRRRK